MRRTVVVAVIGVALVAVGAAALAGVNRSEPSDNANGSVAVRQLATIVGEYVSVNDTGAPLPVLDATPVRLVVEKERISAHAGCNSIQGRAGVEDGRLVVHDLAATEIGCPPDVAAQEEWVIAMLTARPRLERSGPYLSLLWDGHWLGLSSDPADRADRAERADRADRAGWPGEAGGVSPEA
jgi:heat shock protein HslJ